MKRLFEYEKVGICTPGESFFSQTTKRYGEKSPLRVLSAFVWWWLIFEIRTRWQQR